MDYAVKKGVSLSTLRRHIKTNKIQFRVEKGRYLVFDSGDEPLSLEEPRAPLASDQMQRDLQNAREEIAELKTLIAFYEEQMAPKRLDC